MKPKRRPHITEDKIKEASWELLDDHGIEQFTMRKLAAELNIQAPSLYWYYDSKQTLFQALANEVAKEIVAELPNQGTWTEQLRRAAAVIRCKLQQFPCSAQLLIKTRPSEPDYMALMDTLFQMIEPTPLADREKFSLIVHYYNFVVHYSVDEYEQKRVREAFSDEDGTPVDLSGFSTLQRLHEANLFGLMGSDELFDFGIDLLVKGMEEMMRSQGQTDTTA